MNSFWAALRFLTIFPVPAAWGDSEKALSQSVRWFPLIGLLLGALALLIIGRIQPWVPHPLLAALAVLLLTAFSGALHLDGLSDTADGVLSARPREKMLEIMQDSHIGAMGVLAMVGVLLLKFTALLSLPPAALGKTLLLMPLAGRTGMVLHLALLPYVREHGLGTVFTHQARPWTAAGMGLLLLALTAWSALGWAGLVGAGASILVALLLAVYFQRKLGGATGDTYGAVCELTELIPALTLALWPGMR